MDAFHRAGVEAGYTDDGAPGPRPQYGDDYYGGFLRDPDGNSVEAVYAAPGSASPARSTTCGCARRPRRHARFYEAIGRPRSSSDRPTACGSRPASASFSFVTPASR